MMDVDGCGRMWTSTHVGTEKKCLTGMWNNRWLWVLKMNTLKQYYYINAIILNDKPQKVIHSSVDMELSAVKGITVYCRFTN